MLFVTVVMRFVMRFVMEKVIPVKKKTRRACFSSDPRVTEAREEIKAAYKTYTKLIPTKGTEPDTIRPRGS